MARAVQDARKGRGQLTRTPFLYACAAVSDRALEMLSEVGFSLPAYAESLGVGYDIRADAEPGIDVPVHAGMTRALAIYAGTWPKQPLDAERFAALIVIQANGNVEKHLKAAGVDVKSAESTLRSRFLQQQAPRVEWKPEYLLPRARLNEYSLSSSCLQILITAEDFVLSVAQMPVVTTSLVVAAALTYAPAKSAWSLLHDAARRKLSDAEVLTKVDEWVKWYANASGATAPSTTTVLYTMFGVAKTASMETGNGGIIHSHHLLATLLRSSAGIGGRDLLDSLQVDVGEIRRDLFQYAITADPDAAEFWQRQLGGSGPDPGPEHVYATMDIERLDTEDKLGFRDDIRAFATLISSVDVKPPLSIGLFGDWGSGKSFFIEKLYAAVKENAARASALVKDGRPCGFYSRIVQIKFNAWQYVEANLWASLVEHIFRRLNLPDETPDAAVRRRKELVANLDAAMKAQLEAEEKVRVREIAATAAARSLEVKRQASETLLAELKRAVSVDAWEAADISESDKALVNNALQAIGIESAVQSTAQLRGAVSELASLHNRVRLLATWLFTGPEAKKRLLLLAAALVAPLAVAVVLPFVLTKLGTLARDLSTIIAAVSALGGSIAAWIGTQAKSVRSVLDTVDKAKKAVEEKVARAEKEKQAALQAVVTAQEAAEGELQMAQAVLRRAETEVEKARRAADDATPERELVRFIDERVSSDDYRKQLGVLAMVRSDFEQLAELLAKPPVSVDAPMPIERIVLYIDDLDRCPPSRVVQVLHAVHLLLAFPLFVVVVGVDARWVASSLAQEHRALRRGGALPPASDVAGFAATPYDYLEKIFQIPFWLRPMHDDLTKDLLSDLVTVRKKSNPSPLERNDGRDARELRDVNGQPQLVSGSNDGQSKDHAVATQSSDDDPMKPQAMELEEKELTAMKELAPLIQRSPRTVKRFVNVYRLYRATLSRTERVTFLEANGSAARFERVLLLLGIITGTPSISVDCFKRLRAGEEAQLATFADAIAAEFEGKTTKAAAEWRTAAQALTAFAKRNPSITIGQLVEDIAAVSRYSFRFSQPEAAVTPS